MESFISFDLAIENTSAGKGLFKYEKYLDRAIECIKNEEVPKDYFLDPKNHSLLSKFFHMANRTIDVVSDKQFELITLLIEKGYSFNTSYYDICAFNNRYCLNGVSHGIEEDPFLNTTRILNFLVKNNVTITKNIPGDPDDCGYPAKLAAEYFNFGFMKSLIRHSYTFDKGKTFKVSPIPRIIRTASNDILERALDECKKLKLPFDIKDENGNTLIHLAVSSGKPAKIVQLLVEKYGVDPNAENNFGVKPAEISSASVFSRMYLKKAR